MKDTIVILYVCYQASCHIPGLYIENKVPLGFLWNFQMCIVWISLEYFVQKFWRQSFKR